MRFKIIACEILFREFSYLAAQSPHRVDVEFLPRGLHDLKGEEISVRLQERIDAAESEGVYDAILLGYALCNNAIIGLHAARTTMVVPRANDCIALFFGSHERFMEYFNAHPGTYYKTGGWIERGSDLSQFAPDSFQQMAGLGDPPEVWDAKYGKENADFLREQFANMERHYSQLTFIRMGLGPEQRFETLVRDEARQKGWQFDAQEGDLTLLRDMLYGNWDDDRFLIVPPGRSIRNTYDATVITLGPPPK